MSELLQVYMLCHFLFFATDLNVEADTREVLAVPILRLYFNLLWWKGAILGARGDWEFLIFYYEERCMR